MDVLTQYAWIVWLVLILVFATIEVFTLEMTFLMLALGSVAGLLSGLFGIPWWAQFIIAAVVAVALILTLRPPLLRMLRRGGDPARSNIDALIGAEGSVVRTVDLARAARFVSRMARSGRRASPPSPSRRMSRSASECSSPASMVRRPSSCPLRGAPRSDRIRCRDHRPGGHHRWRSSSS